jgi:hypothetical protein
MATMKIPSQRRERVGWPRLLFLSLLLGAGPYTFTFAATSDVDEIALVALNRKALVAQMEQSDSALLSYDPHSPVHSPFSHSDIRILKRAEVEQTRQTIAAQLAANSANLDRYQGDQRLVMQARLSDHPVIWSKEQMEEWARDANLQVSGMVRDNQYIIAIALGVFFLATLVLLAILRDLIDQIGAGREKQSVSEIDAKLVFWRRMLGHSLIGLGLIFAAWSVFFLSTDRLFALIWTFFGYLPAAALLRYRRYSFERDRRGLQAAA